MDPVSQCPVFSGGQILTKVDIPNFSEFAMTDLALVATIRQTGSRG